MNYPKTGPTVKKATKAAPIKPGSATVKPIKKADNDTSLGPKPSETEAGGKQIDSKPKEPISKIKDTFPEQIPVGPIIAEIEKSYQAKLDVQKKTLAKTKIELQTLKEENKKLKFTIEQNEKLIKELQLKFPEDNEGFLAKRSFLLKSKIISQEKNIIILESQVRNMKAIYTEIYVQLENGIRILEKANNEDFGRIQERVGDIVDVLRGCQARLPDLKSKSRYEYGQKIHKDHLFSLEKEEREEDEAKLIERSNIGSRAELEEGLIGMIEMVEELKEKLGGTNHTNTLVNLGHLSRKIVEFIIKEGFDVRRVRKVFEKKNNIFIQKNISYFDYLLQNLKENGEIMKKFSQAMKGDLKEMIPIKGKKSLCAYVEGFLKSLDEEKRTKILKNKEMISFVENITEISRIEKHMHDSQRSILSLFAAKACGEIEKLHNFVADKFMSVINLLESEVYLPFSDIYTIFKNYEGMGNDIKVAVNVIGVLSIAGDQMMQTFQKVLGMKREFLQKNNPNDLNLKMIFELFETEMKKSFEELAN